MASLLPTTLVRADKSTITTAEYLEGKDYLMLYFSASWCGPCVRFTPLLNKWVESHAARLKVATVLVPADRGEVAAFSYLTHMTSFNTMLPFGSPEIAALNKKVGVEGIPTLAVFDASGNLITADAVEALSNDAAGTRFPWKRRTAWEVLEGVGSVVDKAGAVTNVAALRGLSAGIGIYFSAHWCPPCRGFTPELTKWYNDHVVAPSGSLHGKLDIVFASSDHDEGAFKGYMSEMPWKAIPFASREEKAELSSIFGVRGIPTLVFIAPDGTLITADGRSKVSADPDAFPWPPKPWDSLESATSYINDEAVAILFTDMLTDAAIEAEVTTAFQEVAAEYFKDGKPSEAIRFAVAAEGDGAVDQVRKFLGPAHLGDKDGPTVRLTIISVSTGKKFMWNAGTPGVPSKDAIRTFIASFVDGKAEGAGLRT